MRTAWTALGLVTTVTARIGITFYSPEFDDNLVVSSLSDLTPSSAPSELNVVDHVIELKRGEGRSLSSMYVQAIRTAAYQEQTGNDGLAIRAGVAPLTVSGSIYSAPVTIGTNTFQLVVDTGSSDPWIVMSNYTCLDVATKTVEAQSYCGFGPTYDPSKSSTFQRIPNTNFNVSYADGENLNGVMGYEMMSIGGITVTSQEFGAVSQAAWTGDGVSSGLVGLAYSTLTSAYAGTDPTQDVRGRQLKYSPLFNSIFSQGLASPIFSIAMSRDPNSAGLLAIGGIPNIQHSPSFVTVPIQPVGINTTNQLVYQYYSIIIDGFAFSPSQNAQFNVAGTNNPLKTSLLGTALKLLLILVQR
ncbi:hypothetical protein AMS68_007401 [Peltaster fructicola]|uniref:Peptidase A1 domain-containing protein n=1 Tax=Peltaster fructicola TaxID=286661 RepID=A0A6H0Y4E3_9PEZI|nr:hypothetical protein AMS68_007401 [Peltaster fructicola]